VYNYVLAEEETMKKTAIIELSKPVLKGKISLEEAINKRRSVRSFSDKPLSGEEISQLLWAAQGITDPRGLRAAPSAGALYPLEIYVVDGSGLFHYIPQGHKLEILSDKDLRQRLSSACWGQGFIAKAALDIVICAVYERVTSKYGDRGSKYVDMEAGHAAQNLHLQAVALGLVSVPVGAFNDDHIRGVLGFSKEIKPLYVIPVGHKGP